MSREELRKEEDYYLSLGLTICDGCAKKASTSCKLCAYGHEALYVPNPVIQAVRGANNGTQD